MPGGSLFAFEVGMEVGDRAHGPTDEHAPGMARAPRPEGRDADLPPRPSRVLSYARKTYTPKPGQEKR